MEQEELLALIRRVGEGDPEAQEELIRETQQKIYYHCKKMLKNEQDAQDATQDVLIAMLTGIDKLREPAAFWGWVNGITANRCRHLLSAPHKEWQIPEDGEGNSMLDSLEDLDEQYIPDKALDNEETRRMILGLVDDLPPEQRMGILFYYYDEMSVKQIAQAMDTSEGTVKSRLNYARKAIKRGVEDYERKGVKLYSASPLLLLAYFLRVDAEATTLSSSAAAEIAGSVGAAVSGTAVSAAGSATGGSAGAAAAAGAAAKAGGAVSVKVIAGVLAGAVALAGTVGIGVMASQREQPDPPAIVETVEPTPVPEPEPPDVVAAVEPTPAPEPEPPAAVETAEPTPIPEPEPPDVVETVEPTPVPEPKPEPEPEPEAAPFGQLHSFSIVQPQAYTQLPLATAFEDPEVVALPSTAAISRPSISVSAPDGEGYVTYTISYTVTSKARYGSTHSEVTPFNIKFWIHLYDLYDYYTGRKYLTADMDAASGQAESGGSATVEHRGKRFTLTYSSRVRNPNAGGGSWVESAEPGLNWEISIDGLLQVTTTVRAPADYDGVLLGLNRVDMPNSTGRPDSNTGTAAVYWDPAEDNPSHFVFIRLGGA